MNSDEVNRALEEIKATPGKNDKRHLLARYLDDGLFRWAVAQMMLDPRTVFNVGAKTLKKAEELAAKRTGHRDLTFESESLPVHVGITLDALADGSVSGNVALDRLEVLAWHLTPDSWHLLKRILLKKPDAGFSEDSVNAVRPGTVWTFPVMLAKPFEEKRIKAWPVAWEPKIDGWRCTTVCEFSGGDWFPVMRSRTGQEWTNFQAIAAELRHRLHRFYPQRQMGWVIDGEIVSGSFNETASAAGKKDTQAEDAIYRVFDIVPMVHWDALYGTKDFVGGLGYKQRRLLLERLCAVETFDPRVQLIEQGLAHDAETIMQEATRIQAAGGEGVIVKPLDHLYERDRSFSWAKVKGYLSEDIVITGMVEGTGKYVGAMGAVLCDFDGVEVRVGGGWSDEQRREMWANQDDYVGRMIEVGAHEKTPDGSLRHPRFSRWRDDKHLATEAA